MQHREHALWISLASLLLILLLAVFDASADDTPTSPTAAHQWADAILAPEFDASYNRFRAGHPSDRKPGTWDHAYQIDIHDQERWKDAEAKFETLRRAMKKAGY